MLGIGTILNGAAILLGGVAGLTLRKQPAAETQRWLKLVLCLLTCYVGLKTTVMSLGPGIGGGLKQTTIALVAMTLGRLAGRLLHLQKTSNRLGQYAQKTMAAAVDQKRRRFSDGLVTCALLYCVGPMGFLGALLDGFNGQWQTLAIKAVMDGLATMAFMSIFGWGALLSFVPVVAYQGTLTLLARLLQPVMQQYALLDAFNATAGLLVFSLALIVLDIRKVEVADYLPSLAFAPLIAWVWR
jgi:uncharacterized protein